ncbi:MAG TPA: DEAD/DEAH box helicase [Treponema sp.]|nr:DEAD/DEAH box helicase [Treponema sp.]
MEDSLIDEKDEISFEDLGLDETVLAAIEKKGFKTPSPIQVLAIPRLLNGDSNIIAKARTGTGKTAAFGLPIVQNVCTESDHVRALVLEPTRELAIQTCTELQSFTSGKYPRVTVLYGGASYSTQIKELKRGAEIVVGTPGRIKDHIERGTLKLDKIDYFILDEGDEMLDMGFVDDIKSIFASANSQSRILLFSATMPKPILQIAEEFMGEYDICEEEGFVEEPLLIEQKYWVVSERDKIEALVRLVDISPDFYGLVFTMTKNDADMVSRLLDERGYEAAALHGDIPQGQREKILARFRSKKTRVLVATDVAARGIDITGLSHVVNYSLPFDAATYIHRIGRTGRAGTSGIAVTFVRPEERRKLEYLRNAVRRAAKGEMTQEEIPEIDDVLNSKRLRILQDIKEKLGLSQPAAETPVERDASDEVVPLTQDAAAELPAEEETAPKPFDAGEFYNRMAQELCQNAAPKQVLAGVLKITFGQSLDKSHYGRIASNRSRANPNQKRIYVQLGRRDGFNARSIASYFSDLLHIPGRMVDQIDVSQNFSLVSLPSSNAIRALELSKSRKDMPHMHLDSKEENNFTGRSGTRGRGGRGGKDEGRSFGGDRYAVARGERRERGEGRSHRGNDGYKNEHGRTKVHTATRRKGANAYKKSSRHSEEY